MSQTETTSANLPPLPTQLGFDMPIPGIEQAPVSKPPDMPVPDYKAELAGKTPEQIGDAVTLLELDQDDFASVLADPDLEAEIGAEAGWKTTEAFHEHVQAEFDKNAPRLAAYGEVMAELPENKSSEDYGLSLLSEAQRLQEQLASTKALWQAHVDAQFGPANAEKIQIDPMQDKHIAAQYGSAPEVPAARFKSVDEARKAQENKVSRIVPDISPHISLGENYHACMVMPDGEMTAKQAKKMVRDDLVSIKGTFGTSRNDALLGIHANTLNQPMYAAELARQSSAVDQEARAASHPQQRADFDAKTEELRLTGMKTLFPPKSTVVKPIKSDNLGVMTTPAKQAANDTAGKAATSRYKSAGIQRDPTASAATAMPAARRWGSAGSQRQSAALSAPPMQPEKEKKNSFPKPKKQLAEDNPYAKGRAKESNTRKVGNVLMHMAFGLSGGMAVKALYNAITRKKPPAVNEKIVEKKSGKMAEKKPESKPTEQKIPKEKGRSKRF